MINTGNAGCCVQAIREPKKDGLIPRDTRHRQIRYLDNRVEAEHGKFKRVIRPTPGPVEVHRAWVGHKRGPAPVPM